MSRRRAGGMGGHLSGSSHPISSSFAWAGRPAVTGAPAWPAYDLQSPATVLIDITWGLVHDPDRAEREIRQATMRKPG